MDFDRSDAYAAIPEIILKGPRLGGYHEWLFEELKTDDIAGQTTIGVNHSREANDATLTFLAGALIGLAGAAILSAIQEALHILTDARTAARSEQLVSNSSNQ